MGTMGELDEFLCAYISEQGKVTKWIGAKKAAEKMNVIQGTLVNSLKIAKCMERKNEDTMAASQQTIMQGKGVKLLKFTLENAKQNVTEFVIKNLGYDNKTKLYSVTENNLGTKYLPNSVSLGLGNENKTPTNVNKQC